MSARDHRGSSLLKQLPEGRKSARLEAIPTPPVTSSDEAPKSTATPADVFESRNGEDEEIFAPPVGSSDEASLSDGGSPSPTYMASTSIQSTHLQEAMVDSSSDRLSSPPEELYNPASIYPSTDFSVSGSGDRFFSQQNNSKKRHSHMNSGDDTESDWLSLYKPPKRNQITYHRASTTQSPGIKTERRRGNKANGSSPTGKKKDVQFLKPDTASILSKRKIVPAANTMLY